MHSNSYLLLLTFYLNIALRQQVTIDAESPVAIDAESLVTFDAESPVSAKHNENAAAIEVSLYAIEDAISACLQAPGPVPMRLRIAM